MTPVPTMPGITCIRADSPDCMPAGGVVTERSQTGVNMGALKPIAAMAIMAGLLGSPIPPPGRPAGRRRHGFYVWHVFRDWLAYRRQADRGPGGANERR